jgi:hypothetical protein
METQVYAQELARRLNRADVARFRADGDTVLFDGDYDYQVPLNLVDAGSGRREQVERALDRAKLRPHLPVIVGRHFSSAALGVLNAAGANYMDDRHLRVRLLAPSILIRLQDEAEPLPEPRAKRVGLSGVAGGIALALLSDPARDWRVTDLAKEGRASLGAAQNTVVALEAEGVVERVGRGPATRRRVADRAGLLDRYAGDAAADRKVVARGFLLNDGAEPTMRAVSERLSASHEGVRAWFTGVAAAQLLAPHLTAVRNYEVWITTPHRAEVLLDAMGAMAAEDGANLAIMRGREGVLVGSGYEGGIHRASVFRIYADTLADPARGEEQAEHLRGTIIGF